MYIRMVAVKHERAWYHLVNRGAGTNIALFREENLQSGTDLTCLKKSMSISITDSGFFHAEYRPESMGRSHG